MAIFVQRGVEFFFRSLRAGACVKHFFLVRKCGRTSKRPFCIFSLTSFNFLQFQADFLNVCSTWLQLFSNILQHLCYVFPKSHPVWRKLLSFFLNGGATIQQKCLNLDFQVQSSIFILIFYDFFTANTIGFMEELLSLTFIRYLYFLNPFI